MYRIPTTRARTVTVSRRATGTGLARRSSTGKNRVQIRRTRKATPSRAIIRSSGGLVRTFGAPNRVQARHPHTSVSVAPKNEVLPQLRVAQRTPTEAFNPNKWPKTFADTNIQTQLVLKDEKGKVIPPMPSNVHPLPKEITNAFTISMRDSTLQTLRRRLGPWSPMVQKWSATNGRKINLATWKALRHIPKMCTLTRGQIGCYDSHVSIWATIVKNNLPLTLIMEDDPEFNYSAETSKRLLNLFAEMKTRSIKFDLLYLGANRRNHGFNTRHKISPNLTRPTHCVGLFCYLLTLEGAKKLLEQAVPYRVPVDIYTVDQANVGRIKALYANPTYGYVFSLASDTRNIK